MKEIYQNYLNVLKNYANFEGRAGRKEFWLFVLANIIISIVISFIFGPISPGLAKAVSWIYFVGIIVPNLAVGARRLHDIGQSGWWQLIGLIPFIGNIILIIMFALRGQPTENAYGKNSTSV